MSASQTQTGWQHPLVEVSVATGNR